MSTVTSENTFQGEVVDSVQQVNAGKREPVDWMVVAHQDQEMLKRVATVVGADSSVTVQVAQSEWDSKPESYDSALAWSINDGNAKNLLIVGHSEGIAAPNDEAVAEDDRVFGGARKVLAQAKASKEHFATHVDAIVQQDGAGEALESGSLKVHALFYLAHCDTFLLYDITSKIFRPLA